MNFWRSLDGMIRVKLVSADPAAALAQISNAGITVYDADRPDDDIALLFRIRRSDYGALEKLAQRRGYGLEPMERMGIYWALRGLRRRKLLVSGLLLLTILALYLPTRVLFIQVEGNNAIPTNLILEKSAQCGIFFGASRKEVRSEKMKNALLESIPQLQWAGINTYGCVAIISVRERSETQTGEESAQVSNLIASRDGIIVSCTVTRGSSLCRVGQVVRAGQTLVSGYTDCGLQIRAARAEGEVYAQTQRQILAAAPVNWTQKGEILSVEKKYSLIFGKNKINLSKDSGISGTICDKMYLWNYITLPGGFTLPVAIVTQVCTYYSGTQSEQTGEDLLSAFAQRYLSEQMVAGQILSRDESFSREGDLIYMTGNYACIEMIAQARNEENLQAYGNDD